MHQRTKAPPKHGKACGNALEGVQRGVRGVILFSELHQEFFSQNFWGFLGVHTGLCHERFLKGSTTYKVKLPGNLSTSP